MNRESKMSVRFLTNAAIIAAIYVTLTVVFAPISFGPIQFRISEALCVLPYFMAEAIPGVSIGCLLANLICGAAPLDVVFGSLATLIGAIGSYYFRKNRFLVVLPPILSNTIIIPFVLRIAYGAEDMIPFLMLTVGIGEILAIGVLGTILLRALEKVNIMSFVDGKTA